jgi:hypothetical protein
MASITSVAMGIGLGVAAGAGLVMPAIPAGADPPLDCSTGVIVAVDFSPWSETLNSVCDSALPPNGVSALQNAGFAPTGVSGYGLQFICQIDADPPDDSCTSTPPATAYWSLWYAEAGQSAWTYSQQGAEGLEPQAGSIEAWVFGGATGSGQPPIPAPNTLDSSPATTTTPTEPPTQATAPTEPASTPVSVPASPSPGSSAGGATGSQHTTGAGAGAGTGPSATTSTTSDPGRTGASTTNTTGQTPSTRHPGNTSSRSSTGLKIVDSAPASATQQSTGSPVPFLIGAAAVAVVAGSGGIVAWRRRRTG